MYKKKNHHFLYVLCEHKKLELKFLNASGEGRKNGEEGIRACERKKKKKQLREGYSNRGNQMQINYYTRDIVKICCIIMQFIICCNTMAKCSLAKFIYTCRL